MNKKEEIIKALTNTKVYVNGKSKEIQEKLFSLGFTTRTNSNKTPVFIYMPFIIINNKTFAFSSNMVSFIKSQEKEISAEDILNIKVEKECKLKPFDKVLIRNYKDDVWEIDFFERIEGEYYLCLAGSYKHCIPYNKETTHLLGTKEDYIE